MVFTATIKSIENGFVVQLDSFSELTKRVDTKVFYGATLEEVFELIKKNK